MSDGGWGQHLAQTAQCLLLGAVDLTLLFCLNLDSPAPQRLKILLLKLKCSEKGRKMGEKKTALEAERSVVTRGAESWRETPGKSLGSLTYLVQIIL